MSRGFAYADAGVNRELRTKSKVALSILEQTFGFSIYGEVLQLPYGNIFPFGDRFIDLVIEGVGTKVLIAQLANKYDTIGIDGVAMAVNDVIRSGARPLALADNIHAQVSKPSLVRKFLKGIVKGALEAECLVPSGEIGDVAEIVKGMSEGKGFDMVFSCLGEVYKERIIFGDDIKPGDVVVGLRSSGIHSNGITLARKVLFKQWGGKYEPYYIPDGFERELVYEALEPTRIYVKPILDAVKNHLIKGAIHVTGDAYLKFGRLMKFSKGIGFEFNNLKPQSIFKLIQETAPEVKGEITDEEMLKTFNMGWGFAIVTDKTEKDSLLSIFEKRDLEAEQIGNITDSGRIVASYRGKRIELK
jgi:phosphoribosylformylglycinamidine cyclo-ligase